MFAVTVDRPRRLLMVRLEGLLDVQEVLDLREAIRAAMAENGFAPRGFFQITDISGCPIQPQAVVKAVREFDTDTAILPQKLAVQTGLSPARMQARRGQARCPRQLFETRAQALAWLYDSLVVGASHSRAAAA